MYLLCSEIIIMNHLNCTLMRRKTKFEVIDGIRIFLCSSLVFWAMTPLNMLSFGFNTILCALLDSGLTYIMLRKFIGHSFEIAFFIISGFFWTELFVLFIDFRGTLNVIMSPIFWIYSIILTIAAYKYKSPVFIILLAAGWIYFIFWGHLQWLDFRCKNLTLYDFYIKNM